MTDMQVTVKKIPFENKETSVSEMDLLNGRNTVFGNNLNEVFSIIKKTQ